MEAIVRLWPLDHGSETAACACCTLASGASGKCGLVVQGAVNVPIQLRRTHPKRPNALEKLLRYNNASRCIPTRGVAPHSIAQIRSQRLFLFVDRVHRFNPSGLDVILLHDAHNQVQRSLSTTLWAVIRQRPALVGRTFKFSFTHALLNPCFYEIQ